MKKGKTVGNKEETGHFSSIHLYKMETAERLLLIKQRDVSDTMPHFQIIKSVLQLGASQTMQQVYYHETRILPAVEYCFITTIYLKVI